MTLFKRAKSGARGKEATKRETKPNWMTVGVEKKKETHKQTYNQERNSSVTYEQEKAA